MLKSGREWVLAVGAIVVVLAGCSETVDISDPPTEAMADPPTETTIVEASAAPDVSALEETSPAPAEPDPERKFAALAQAGGGCSNRLGAGEHEF